ncbi:MAG TPA: circadian clock protein KaiC [Steroidobacteraceae bacterium]|nr:circadian clock protein KaiC [Steroidobacteraceae bacterium]
MSRSEGVLEKAPTGIRGLDEITGGGLPAGRATLICGGPGSGKTLVALSFLVNGVRRFGEPGVLMTFEENADDLACDVASLGFNLPELVASGKLVVDYVRVERSEIEETGEYDLEGLFVRLEHAVRESGAKRVVLDTIESLFGGLSKENILRAELRRLLRWLKDRDLTVVITGERGRETLTRQGLEEYVSDAVILLDHRVHEELSTRRLRIVKYRGSHHGTNEYPFLIDRDGLGVLPVTSLGLDHPAPTERISSGVEPLDAMLGGRGFYRGSTVLLSGTAGTGKTTLAASFVNAACERGERCLYFLLEESPRQMIRNMRSIGVDLGQWVERGLLQMPADRPSRFGLESHLAGMYRTIDQVRPQVVVVDSMTDLLSAGELNSVRAMLVRLIDHLKMRSVTALLTSLTPADAREPDSNAGVSSLMDAWVLVSLDQSDGVRQRHLSVLKARGTAHSNRVYPFTITEQGIRVPVCDAVGRGTAAG